MQQTQHQGSWAHLCSWGWHEQTQRQGSWAHLCPWGFTLWLQKVSILLQPRKKLYQQPQPLVKALTTPSCNCLLTHPSPTLDCDLPEGWATVLFISVSSEPAQCLAHARHSVTEWVGEASLTASQAIRPRISPTSSPSSENRDSLQVCAPQFGLSGRRLGRRVRRNDVRGED